MPDLRNRIGKAICDATSAGKLFPWDTLNDRERETWRGYADSVIAEIGLSRQEAHDTWDTMLVDHHRYTTDWINSHE